jgi:hypothetical protein
MHPAGKTPSSSVPGVGPSGKKFIPGAAWFIFVLILLFLPGSDLPSVGGWANLIYFDKWVHTGLFAVLAFLFMYPFSRSGLTPSEKWHYLLRIALAASLWGLTSEIIQKYFVPGRSFDLFDWAADSLGAAIALFYSRYRLHKQN